MGRTNVSAKCQTVNIDHRESLTWHRDIGGVNVGFQEGPTKRSGGRFGFWRRVGGKGGIREKVGGTVRGDFRELR